MNRNKADRVKEERLTYDDYAALPDDGNRYELASGALELLSPAPSPTHQMISHRLVTAFTNVCEKDYIILYAPLDVILAEDEVRQPDIVVINRERQAIVTDRGIEGPPDLVVEILSPSTALKDRRDKKEVYAAYGVKEYWIVDPVHETIEQWTYREIDQTKRYELNGTYGNGDTITSPHVKCLDVHATNVFNDPFADV